MDRIKIIERNGDGDSGGCSAGGTVSRNSGSMVVMVTSNCGGGSRSGGEDNVCW